MRRRLLDVRHPWFRPLWPRALSVAALAAWTLYEIANGNLSWALVFGAAAAFLAYEFFVVFDPENYAPGEEEGREDGGGDGGEDGR